MKLRTRTIISLILMSALLFTTVSIAFAQTDTDKDGIIDSQDRCPYAAGPASNGGCPLPKPPTQPQPQKPNNDKDGDGTLDDSDRCPLDGGPSWNAGCPAQGTPTPTVSDRDGDGVPDSQDGCPGAAGPATNGGCLPTLPDTGPCVLATKGNEKVHIRALPAVQNIIVDDIDPGSPVPALDKLESPDGDWFFTGDGWAAGWVTRLGGDCGSLGDHTPVELCSLLGDLSSVEMLVLRKAGFSGNCRNTDTGELVPAVIPNEGDVGGCDGSVKSGELVPAVQTGDGSAQTGELVPAVQTGDGSVKLCDGSVVPAVQTGDPKSCDGSVMPIDFNGDGVPDNVLAGGSGEVPFVKVTDGKTSNALLNFMAYDLNFKGGVNVSAGDVNGDGVPELVTGVGAGAAPHVKVFDGKTLAPLASFFAYAPTFTGGVRVAVGDVNGDGIPELITGAGPGGAPHVKVFDGKTLSTLASFFAFSPAFTGGVRVAVGDVNGDCVADILTQADLGGGKTHTRAFDGKTQQILLDTLAPMQDFH